MAAPSGAKGVARTSGQDDGDEGGAREKVRGNPRARPPFEPDPRVGEILATREALAPERSEGADIAVLCDGARLEPGPPGLDRCRRPPAEKGIACEAIAGE